MLTKEIIHDIKIKGYEGIYQLLNNFKNDSSILFILKNLGQLPPDFNGTFLIDFLYHPSSSIRLWTVKTIGKLQNGDFLEKLKEVAIGDKDTMVRREAVSSIGRKRDKQSLKVLFEILGDSDPKITSQAIRALLVFKGDEQIDSRLKPLVNHQNEMVRQIIYKEYFANRLDKNETPHAHSPDFLKNAVVNGDTIETMKMIKDESVHLTFTSPPYYNARDYSIYPSYKHYLEFLATAFKEVHRITKEGRFFILNTSPVIIPRISRAHSSKRYPIPFDIHPYLVDMGWEFIDDIVWLKPEASVKNRVGGFMQHRKPLGYKPNTVTEYLMVYRKSTDKLLDWNMHQYDSETINQSRVSGEYETTNVWEIGPSFDKVHSAVFPSELCKRVISYYSYKGDLVFDPFGGSGTVGRVAKSMGRYFFLTEKNEEYFKYMVSKKQNGVADEHSTRFLSFGEFKELIK
jgi:DNA modification methylase